MDPDISIIVPTRGRVRQLGRLLERLARQDCLCGIPPRTTATAFEVVVGLDGHDAAEAAVLPAKLPFPVKYLPLPHVGISAAKNAAIANARGQVLLLVNDDIEPEPGFVAAHAAAHKAGCQVVLGASPFVRWPDQNVFDELVARTRMIFFHNELVDGGSYNFRYAWNLNLSVDRRLIERMAPPRTCGAAGQGIRAAGPFSDRLQPVFFDDVEFAYRLMGDASQVTYCAAALAPHRHRYDFAGYFEREALLGVMSTALAEVNPACHRTIFNASPEDLLSRARQSLPLDVPDGRRLLRQFAETAAETCAAELADSDCNLLYAFHLPLKRRAFRCGLVAAADAPDTPWTLRAQVAVDALGNDPVFSQSPHWSAGRPGESAQARPQLVAPIRENAVPSR